jgi:hypothetical protein
MNTRWPNLDAKTNTRRAASRRRLNERMKIQKAERRAAVARALADASAAGQLPRGFRSALARSLGVHKSVITREYQAILAGAN